jgi:hypothetical protein
MKAAEFIAAPDCRSGRDCISAKSALADSAGKRLFWQKWLWYAACSEEKQLLLARGGTER